MRTLMAGTAIVLGLFCVAVAQPVQAPPARPSAEPPPDERRQAQELVKKAKVSMRDAIKAALKEVKGKPYVAALGSEEGRTLYAVFILDKKKFMEVYVDAISGKAVSAREEPPPAGPEETEARQEVPRALAGAKVDMRDAVQEAAKAIKGAVPIVAQLILEKGRALYQVELLVGDHFAGVKIDATSGKVLQAGQELPILAAWNFDQDRADKVPPGWIIRETNSSGKPATWKVIPERTAFSQPNAFCLTQTQNVGKTYNLALAEKTSYADLDMTVRVKGNTGKEDQGGGLVWRAADENNYYVCRMNPLETNFRVYKVVDGKRTQLQSAEVETKTGQWYAVRVIMIGDHIMCLLEGEKLLDVRDTTFDKAGMIGLWTKADAASCFDDLVVAQPVEQPLTKPAPAAATE